MAEQSRGFKDGIRLASIAAGVLMGASYVVSVVGEVSESCPPSSKSNNDFSFCAPVAVISETLGPVGGGITLKPLLHPEKNNNISPSAAYFLGAIVLIGLPVATYPRSR